MSIPSVFGLFSGAIMWRLETRELLHEFMLIWHVGLSMRVKPLRFRFSQAWKCKACAWYETIIHLILKRFQTEYKSKYFVVKYSCLSFILNFVRNVRNLSYFTTYSWPVATAAGKAFPPGSTLAINSSSTVDNKVTYPHETDPCFPTIISPFPSLNAVWGNDSSIKLSSQIIY